MGNTLDPPPEIVDSWPAANYVNPEQRGSGLIVLTAILMTITCLAVTVRIYTRLRITRAFGLDDALILLSYCLSIALSVLIVLGNVVYHSGYHVWDVPPTTYVAHRRNIWWSELIYVLTSCAVKLSVLLFYRRLSTQFSIAFLWAVRAGFALNLAYFIGFGGLLFTICIPLDAYWNSFDPYWKLRHPRFFCHPENVALPLSAALSVATDLYATIVPLWLVSSIDKSLPNKTGLYVIFSLGFLAVLFGTLRTVYVYQALNINYDFTWVLYDCWIYTQLEINLAIVAACAPSLRPLMIRCAQILGEYNQELVTVRPLSQRTSVQTENTYINSVVYPAEGRLERGQGILGKVDETNQVAVRAVASNTYLS